jgi:hypothetical protein
MAEVELRQQARREMSGGQPERALATITTGLARDPRDGELQVLLDELLGEAAARAANARREADAAGVARQGGAYVRAVQRLRAAERYRTADQKVRAIRELWAASEIFTRAMRDVPAPRARATQPAGPASPAANSASTPSAPPASSAPPPLPAPVSGAVAIPTPPPPPEVAAAPPLSPPTPDPAPAREPTETAIRRTLQAYEAAWEALDLEAIGRAQRLNTTDAARIEQTIGAARRYVMEIDVRRIDIAADNTRATAVCEIAREFHPRVGRVSRQIVTSTVELEQRDGRWVIVAVH